MRVLLVAYRGFVKGEEKPFEEVPEDRPLAVVVGAGELLKGVEKALEKMKEGEEKEIVVPPEEGYGKRDPEKIAVIPLREFKKRSIDPFPGLVVEVNDMRGRVLSVSGGRVQVDFNHELAGKTLVYRVKVLKELKKPEEIAEALFRRFFGRDPAEVVATDDYVHITYVPGNVERDTLSKVLLVSRLLRLYPEVRVTEVFRRQGER